MLEREELCRLIPHGESMCLLDHVKSWDENSILCSAVSQTDPDNPLCNEGLLDAINGVEYAAQAMAVHGALLEGGSEQHAVAYLAALRGLHLHTVTLQQYPEIDLHCQRLGGDSQGFIYSFEVRAENKLLLEGRATVIKERENI